MRDKKKALTILFLFFSLCIQIVLQNTGSGAVNAIINSSIGFYLSQSFLELFTVWLLHQPACKEAVLIMIICLASVVLNIIGFTANVLGADYDSIINIVMWVLFFSQFIFLFSTRITGIIYGGVSQFSLVRNYCTCYLSINNKGAS
jgi:hypothetical protein